MGLNFSSCGEKKSCRTKWTWWVWISQVVGKKKKTLTKWTKACNSCVTQQPTWWRKERVKCMESIHNGRSRRWESWFWRGGEWEWGGGGEGGKREEWIENLVAHVLMRSP